MNKDDAIVEQAIQILRKKVTSKKGKFLSQSSDVHKLLTLELGSLEHEVFGVIALDSQLRYIDHEVLFRGSLIYTAISPREVVKFALLNNAANLILYHNHPTFSRMPSPGDKELTKMLVGILRVIEVNVLDHMIIAGDEVTSFNDLGLL